MGCVFGRDAASPSRRRPSPASSRRRPSPASSRRLSPHPEPQPHLSNIPSHREGELIAAGWPDWLAAAAGEAIYGWSPCPASNYQKLDKIGRGTYSNVYKGREVSTNRTVALKCVRPNGLDPESIEFMAREILVLRRLDHPNIVKLEGIITSRMSSSLFLVFEYMDHDLAGLNGDPSIKFSEPQVKCYMKQLLAGLEHCHERGVLHRDIKGPNLLLNNSGVLKIADFGLAALFDVADRQPMTSKVVTLWYRSPELLLGATEYGVGVDLWSTGCILGELLARRPILPGRTEVEQLHTIFKLCGSPTEEYWVKSKLPHAAIYKPKQPYKQRIRETYPHFTAPSLSLIETLLAMDPVERQTASSALRNEYFTTQPLPCAPSSLPQYPPSKEMDAKRRKEEAKRLRVDELRNAMNEVSDKTCPRDRAPRVVPDPMPNGELEGKLNRMGLVVHPTPTESGKFRSHHQDGDLDFSGYLPPPAFDPPAAPFKKAFPSHRNAGSTMSGPLVGVGAAFRPRQKQQPAYLSRQEGRNLRRVGHGKPLSDNEKTFQPNRLGLDDEIRAWD